MLQIIALEQVRDNRKNKISGALKPQTKGNKESNENSKTPVKPRRRRSDSPTPRGMPVGLTDFPRRRPFVSNRTSALCVVVALSREVVATTRGGGVGAVWVGCHCRLPPSPSLPTKLWRCGERVWRAGWREWWMGRRLWRLWRWREERSTFTAHLAQHSHRKIRLRP